MFNFFRRKRKLSDEEKKFQLQISNMLGYTPNDLDVYQRAFKHKSIFEGLSENNERLEFLGDSVLDAIVADFLYKHYKTQNEGFLTKMRAKIVSRKTLNQLAIKMHVHEMVEAQVEQETHQTSLAGNALEALIGSIYLDRGYNFTEQFVQDRILARYIDLNDLEMMDFDPKSKLIERSQKERFKLVFNTRLKDPDSKVKEYICTISKDEVAIGDGVGSSKKKAEQEAARNALAAI